MIHRPCPPTHRWAALLTDSLPPAEQADLNGHLELCPACQRALEDCAAHRDAWAVTARSLGHPGPTRDQALRDVIDQLKLDPESDHDSSDGAELPLDFLDPSEHGGSLGRIHQYEVLEEVGRGGMGVVLKALDPALHRVVAIKVLAPQLAVSGTARKRFTREARAAAAVGHENVVTIHAVEEFKGLPYLVMQYIAGPSVQQRLADGGPLPVAEILRIGFQTAAGLAAAHAQGLVHRDVKPANILLENGVERVKLTDFSLARAIDDASVTQTGVVTGTPPFMAPEQARGEPLDHRADLFSLGSVLYALSTGRPPFRGRNSLDVLRRVSEETPPPIRSINPEIPAWLEAIVTKLMAKKPEDRYQSAGEVAALLERCLAHVQQPTVVPLPAGVIPPQSRKRRWLIATAAAAVAALLLAVTVLRIKTEKGTLEISVDDPQAKVTVDGTDIVVSGIQGVQEFRLKAGDYAVHQTKNGKPEKTEIVSIKQGEKTPLRVTFEGNGLSATAAVTSGVPAGGNVYQKRIEVLKRMADDLDAARVQQKLAAEQLDVAQLQDANKAELLKARDDLAGASERAAEMEKAIKNLQESLNARRSSLLAAKGENDPAVKEIEDQLAIVNGLRLSPVRVNALMQPRINFPTALGKISSAVFAPAGKTLFVAVMGGGIHAYDLASGQKRFAITGPEAGRYLAISPDGKTLASGGTDASAVRLWDAVTGKQIRTLSHDQVLVHALAFSADGKSLAVAGGSAVGGSDGSGEGKVILWDLSSNTAQTVTTRASALSAAFAPGGGRLAVGLDGENVQMIDPAKAEVSYSVRLPGPVRALAFSADGRRLAVSSGDGRVNLFTGTRDWRVANHRGIDTLIGQAGQATAIQFSPGGNWLVTASQDGTAMLWNMSTRKIVATLGPGMRNVCAGIALFTPDGKSVVTAGTDGYIRIWDVTPVDGSVRVWDATPFVGSAKPAATRVGVPVLEDLPQVGPLFRNPSDDQQRVLRQLEKARSDALNAQAQLNAARAKSEAAARGDDAPIAKAELKAAEAKAEAAQRLLKDAVDEMAKQQQRDNGPRPQRTFPTAADKVSSAVFSRDGKNLFLADWGGTVYSYDFASGKLRFTLAPGKDGENRYLAVSPDDSYLVAVGAGSTIQFIDHGKVRQSLAGGCNPYYAVAFSSDGKTLAAGGYGPDGRGGRVELWYVDSARMDEIEFSDPVRSLAFSPGRKDRLAVGTSGDNVHLIDPSVAKEKDSLGQPGPVHALAFSPDGERLAASSDTQVHVWNWGSGREVATLSGDVAPITFAQFSPDGRWFLTKSLVDTAKLWDVATRRCVATLGPGPGKVASALFTPDGQSVVIVEHDHVIRVWDVAAFVAGDAQPGATTPRVPVPPQARTFSQPQRSFQAADGGPIRSAAFGPDGRSLYVAGEKRPIQDFDLQNGAAGGSTSGRWGTEPLVVMSPDGETLATGGTGGVISFWNVRTGKQWLADFSADFLQVGALAFSLDGKTLAAGGTGTGKGLVKLCNVKSGSTRSIEYASDVLSLAFDPGDQTRLAIGLQSKTVQVVNATTGKFICATPLAGPTTHMSFSADGTWLAVTQGDNKVLLRDWNGGGVAATITAAAGQFTGVRISPNGKQIAIATTEGAAKLYDVSTGKLAATFAPNAGKLFVAEFSPDGRWLATAGEDRTIRMWDLSSLVAAKPAAPDDSDLRKELAVKKAMAAERARREEATATAERDAAAKAQKGVTEQNFQPKVRVTEPRRTFPADTAGPVSAAAFSPDGTRLYVAGQDGSVLAREFADGKRLFSISGTDGENRLLAMRHDGKLFATAGLGSSIRFWDAATGKQINAVNTHAEDVTCLAFRGNGSALAVGTYTGGGGDVREFADPYRGFGSKTVFENDRVVLVACAPAGPGMAIATNDHVVNLVGVPGLAHGFKIKQSAAVAALAFHPDGNVLAVASGNRVELWSLRRGEAYFTLADAGPVTSVQFSSDGRFLVTAGLDGVARLWTLTRNRDAKTAELVPVYIEPSAAFAPKEAIKLRVAAFTPDSKSLITAGDDKTIRVWDLAPFAPSDGRVP